MCNLLAAIGVGSHFTRPNFPEASVTGGTAPRQFRHLPLEGLVRADRPEEPT
jgi:hypothetical protein